MKQQNNEATQLSLFGDPEPTPQLPAIPLELSINTESREEFEMRRVGEMAEKLHWPALYLEPMRVWPGITISAGESGWHEMLDQSSSGTIGLVMLALHKLIQPLTPTSIDEMGFYHEPVEVLSRFEERSRTDLIRMAEYLEWPRIPCWISGRMEVFGPGEDIWRKYAVYGNAGLIADASGALERRLRGEPDRDHKTAHKQLDDEDDE